MCTTRNQDGNGVAWRAWIGPTMQTNKTWETVPQGSSMRVARAHAHPSRSRCKATTTYALTSNGASPFHAFPHARLMHLSL